MKPIVHGLEARYTDRMAFTYLDIDDQRNDEWKSTLGFVFRPHFMLLDGGGNMLQQWIGPVREEDFVTAFESALGQ